MLNTGGGIFSPEVAFFLLQEHFFTGRSHYFATFGGIIWVLMLAFFLKLSRTIARCLQNEIGEDVVYRTHAVQVYK